MTVRRLLEEALAEGVGTAAQAVAMQEGRLVCDVAVGRCGPDATDAVVRHETRFDVASVTKLWTTTIAARLVEGGALDLDVSVASILDCPRLKHVSVRALLAHRSGLPAWAPLFDEARADPLCAGLWPDDRQDGGTDRALARRRVLDAALRTTPGQPVRRYSDLGFLVLTSVLEHLGGAPLDILFRDLVAAPLDLDAGFRRLSTHPPDPSIPATGVLRPREPAPGQEDAYRVGPQHPRLVPGQVDDDNAWAADGVAGHAGGFASAHDLATFGQAWMEDAEGAGTLLPAHLARAFLDVDRPDLLPVRGLGWDHIASEGSTAGDLLGRGPRGGVGHLGFTGTSLWIDLDRRLVVVLTTNRTLPSRTARLPIRRLRRRLHDAIATETL